MSRGRAAIRKETSTKKDKIIKKLKEKLQKKEKEFQELKKETENLITELDNAYKELRKTQEVLIVREKLSIAGVLAAGIAHEIRNPLSIIGMSVQILHDKLPNKDERREFTKAIMNKVQKINRVVTDLIRFAEPQRLNFRRKNIHKVIDRMCRLAKYKCHAQKINLIREYKTNSSLVFLDENLIEQVFLNLIDNAIWAMPDGGRLMITTNAGRDNFEINIADTGCGIPADDIAHIFDPFFTRKENGSGLGLSIVHRIIEDHKGSIEVESQLNEGTAFTIKLPICQDKGLKTEKK